LNQGRRNHHTYSKTKECQQDFPHRT